MPLASLEEAIEDFKQGKFVIIVDDEDRENEGDLCVAAEMVTPEAINYMAKYGRGLICMPILGKRLDELKIPMAVEHNTAPLGTAFTVSVDAIKHVTTGISAHDRSATIKAILDPNTRPEDLARPGHMFPLRAREGGVLVRGGQTEAVIDLAVLAGLYPAGVICEIMSEDGTMARMPQLEEFALAEGIKIISVAQLIAHRRHTEKLIQRVAEASLPTRFGEFRAIAYRSTIAPYSGDEHVALVMGDLSIEEPILVRVHSQCLTGDVFHSMRCDCGDQVDLALEAIAAEGRGVFVYLRQEGRGIGLHNKIKAYALQDLGLDTVEANQALGFPPDLREYGIGAQMLLDLGVKRLRILTNNPKKMAGFDGYGMEVVEQLPLIAPINERNRRYMETKRVKMGHILEAEATSEPRI